MRTIKQNSVQLLLGIALVSFVLFTFSCTQESVLEPSDGLEVYAVKSSNAKKATRAIKGRLNNDATTSDIPPNMDCGFPLSANDIFGNMTHIGKIQPMSFGIPTSCAFGEEPGTLETTYNVNYIGAHGDEIWTVESPTIICFDEACFTGTFVGTIEIVGGTGRFEGATGSMVFKNARFEGSVSHWEVEGTITY